MVQNNTDARRRPPRSTLRSGGTERPGRRMHWAASTAVLRGQPGACGGVSRACGGADRQRPEAGRDRLNSRMKGRRHDERRQHGRPAHGAGPTLGRRNQVVRASRHRGPLCSPQRRTIRGYRGDFVLDQDDAFELAEQLASKKPGDDASGAGEDAIPHDRDDRRPATFISWRSLDAWASEGARIDRVKLLMCTIAAAASA